MKKTKEEVNYKEDIIKLGIILVLLILALILIHQFSKPTITPSPDSVPTSELEQTKEKIDNATKTIEELREEERQEYLLNQTRDMLLKNPVVKTLDSFFTKISIVFRVLFGEPYSLSLTLFILIIFYIWFTILMSELLGAFGFLPKKTSFWLALGFSIILAQLSFFRFIVDFSLALVFARETWIARIIIIFGVIFVLVLFGMIQKQFAKYLEQKKEEKQKAETEAARKGIQNFFKKMMFWSEQE